MHTTDLLSLLKMGEYISGEEIARRLKLSRNSVWKAINLLRKDGYIIEGGTKKGYLLVSSPDILKPEEIQAKVGADFTIQLYDCLDSTNAKAMTLAQEGASSGTVILANEQKAGRGRKGREFFSPRGKSIYMSLILRSQLSHRELPLVTAFMGTAAALAIDEICGVETGIKWVNDLYLGGKKIAGILSQASLNMESGSADFIVIGIGINVNLVQFPPELSPIAASIEQLTGKAVSRSDLIAKILANCRQMDEKIRQRSFLEEYRRRSIVLGKKILVCGASESYEAVAEEIDDNAALLVRLSNGEIKILDSGEVSIKKSENERLFL